MNIYIAGPFSQEKERQALLQMIDIIKKRYFNSALHELYIPMDFKVEGDFQKLDGTWNLPNYIWAKKVFEADLEYLQQADIVFALYTGHYCSSGSIWEIGYAIGRKIPVIAYIPDWVIGGNVSLMVMNSFDGFIDNDGIIHSFTEKELSNYNQK